MGLYDTILAVGALIPAIVLCRYIYKKDRTEKEPKWLLLLLFFFGAAVTYPAGILEAVVQDRVLSLFLPVESLSAGEIGLNYYSYRVYSFIYYFFGVAVIEEGLKFAVLYFITHKSKNFNSLFDGMIYSVFVSLGFAAFENMLYVFEYGFSAIVQRAFTAVPAHFFFAVIMGYFYSYWHLYKYTADTEKSLAQMGIILLRDPPFNFGKYIASSLTAAMLTHGFYDFCLQFSGVRSTFVFFCFLSLLYLYCFGKIRFFSKIDNSNRSITTWLLARKYPEAADEIIGYGG